MAQPKIFFLILNVLEINFPGLVGLMGLLGNGGCTALAQFLARTRCWTFLPSADFGISHWIPTCELQGAVVFIFIQQRKLKAKERT